MRDLLARDLGCARAVLAPILRVAGHEVGGE